MKENLAINDLVFMDQELAVKWNDDKQSYISLKELRNQCPCAFCSGEKDALGNIYKGPRQELQEIAYTAIKWERVGHYALRIFWGDHHSDGLYTYEMLRRLGID